MSQQQQPQQPQQHHRPARAVLALAAAALALPLASGAAVAAGHPGAGRTRTADLPQCATADLAVSRSHGQGAAGSVYLHLRLTNTSDASCRTGGYGGVSYVGDGDGTQIGLAAKRVNRDRVHVVRLDPGERAIARLQEVDALNYSRRTCRPAAVDGLRVYPPNQTASAYVVQSTTGCRSHHVRLLFLSPYHHRH